MKIKICGLTKPEDIAAVNKFMPDYIGFVFYEKSRRFIEMPKAAMLKKSLDSSISAVGVFVNADINYIETLCRQGIIDLVQLHGTESEEYVKRLKALTDKPLIRAVRVKSREDILKAENTACDYLLLDTYCGGFGGSGKSFDHKIIPSLEKPYFLAGGINKDNICTAAENCKPYCMDVSSGCETDGVKDERKIKEIISIVRKED